MFEKLALISVLTTLVTEAVKRLFGDNKTINSNIIASVASCILTIGVQIYTYIMTNQIATTQTVAETVALILLSFLTATLGYDKVIQTLQK
jgi:hypothetical protein